MAAPELSMQFTRDYIFYMYQPRLRPRIRVEHTFNWIIVRAFT